jgi:hypothetical protein
MGKSLLVTDEMNQHRREQVLLGRKWEDRTAVRGFEATLGRNQKGPGSRRMTQCPGL